jgi:hypothetical protein
VADGWPGAHTRADATAPWARGRPGRPWGRPAATAPRPRRVLLAALALTALAGALRFATLGQQSLWEDETVTYWLLEGGLGHVLHQLPHTESTPPLFFVLESGAGALLGRSELALRAISALAGTATVPLVFAIGRRTVSARAGLVAAALVAVSPDLVWYSQEARAYALMVALVAATLYLLALATDVREPERRRDRALLGWGACAALALATHYFAIFVVAPQALWLVARAGPTRRVLGACALPAAAGAALLPLALAQHASGGAGYLADIQLAQRLGQLPTEWSAGPPAPVSYAAAYALAGAGALVALALLLTRADARERRVAAWMAALLAAGLAGPLLAEAFGLRILDERNAMALLLALILLLACGLGARRAPRLGTLAAALLCLGLGGVDAWRWLDADVQRENWRRAARALGAAPRLRALVIAPVTDNPPPIPHVVALTGAYLPDVRVMHASGALVAEVDVLDVRGVPYFDDVTTVASPVSPGLGFGLAGRVDGPGFRLFRFRRRAPVLVTPRMLRRAPLLPRSPDVMVGVQAPPGRTPATSRH